jgi:hypothetical protein
MSLASRVVWISMCGLLWSAACANELPEAADNNKAAGGSPASPVISQVTAGSASVPAASKPIDPPATTPASSGTTSQPSRSTASPAATSGGVGGAGSSASPVKPAASNGSSGSGGSVAAPTTPVAGSAAPPAAGSGVAGAEAFPDLGEILPPLSTPETRVPSPDNPAECPATAPENPVGDCLGLPVYLECNYGTYYCVCDWFHWLCAG